MCQYSLGGTKIARGAEVQSLRLAECRAESEKQWGCVGGLQRRDRSDKLCSEVWLCGGL